MSLDKATVSAVARLARLRLTDAEVEAMALELSRIVAWIDQLDEVDTSTVAPLTQVGGARSVRRQDVVSDGGIRDAVLANAPATEKGFFVVPKVIE